MQTHVITSCTDRKKVPIPERCSIRSIEAVDLGERVDEWLSVLRSDDLPRRPVPDVYGGEHWTEFLALLDQDMSDSRTGWVISAGYGLIPTTADIAGYSATFATGNADSVRPSTAGWSHRDWWAALGRERVPGYAGPRTISEITQTAEPSDQVLCVASPSYLKAVQDDLALAADHLGDADRFVVLGTAVPNSLVEHPHITAPTYDSRLQSELGGSLIGLNIRVAARVMEGRPGPVGTRATSILDGLMSGPPAPPRNEGKRADDEEIKAFISEALREAPDVSASPLLRRWRDSGQACEQGRFRDLYRKVRANRSVQLSLADSPSPVGEDRR